MISQNLFQKVVQVLQLAIGNNISVQLTLSQEEWKVLYEFARKQSILGIYFAGISKLPKEQRPSFGLYMQWLAVALQIKQQNEHLDRQTAKIWKQLKKDSLDTVILKGQGIAQEYGELAEFRQSGDIDIWVKGGFQTVSDYVQRTIPTEDLAYHRFHYHYFDDTEVELHHRPTLMRNLFDDRKLARWYNSFSADDFVYLKDKGFAVPTVEFNRIFILTHIYRHFLFEGIGLRQIVDYYFVLKSDTRCKKGEVTETLRSLRLTRFAEAMMWILHTQLGLEEKNLICGMNEKEGRFVLGEILQTGNFGQGDSRYRYKRWFKLRHHIAHGSHLLIHYPSEVIWTPFWLLFHKIWKTVKILEIRNKRN